MPYLTGDGLLIHISIVHEGCHCVTPNAVAKYTINTVFMSNVIDSFSHPRHHLMGNYLISLVCGTMNKIFTRMVCFLQQCPKLRQHDNDALLGFFNVPWFFPAHETDLVT